MLWSNGLKKLSSESSFQKCQKNIINILTVYKFVIDLYNSEEVNFKVIIDKNESNEINWQIIIIIRKI